MFKNFKIKTKIILPIILTAVFVLSAATFYSYYFVNNILKTEVVKHLKITAKNRADHIETYLNQNIERMKLITSKTQLKTELEKYNFDKNKEALNKMKEIIQDSKVSVKELERICVVGLDGTVITSTDDNFCGENIVNKYFFQQGKKKEAIYFIKEDMNMKMFVTGPFIKNNKLIGVGITVVDINYFKDIVKDRTGLGNTGEVLVAIQGEGKRIYLFERLFEKEAIAQDVESLVSAEPMKQALLGNEMVFTDTLDYRDEPVLAVSEYLKIAKIGLVSKIDQSEAFALSKDLLKFSVIRIIIILLIFFIITYLLANAISKPIATLYQGIKIIEKGDLSHRVAINSNDEIGKLVNSFNVMTMRLEKSKKNIKKKIAERTADLEKLNKYMTGRELKMMELKKEIQELKEKIVTNKKHKT